MKQTEKQKGRLPEDSLTESRLTDLAAPLLRWYGNNARRLPWREAPDPYGVWISEIMLQQTRVEAVKPYFERWMKAFPELSSLAAAAEEEVLKLWEGLGYYSRARNIYKTAKIVMKEYGGKFPSSVKELRSLPGIGDYTAGAIGSIAFHLPVPCVDGNVMRVMARLTALKEDIASAAVKRLLTERIGKIIPEDRPGDFNQALMELGAMICLPNGLPKCIACPVSFLCEAYRQNRIAEFPVKSGKPSRKVEERTVLVLIKNNEVALRKRPETGLLANLWEFPNFPGIISEEEIRRILCSMDLNPVSLTRLEDTKHVFTHIEWKMSGYLAAVEEKKTPEACAHIAEATVPYPAEAGFQWIDAGLLRDRLTIPAAFKRYYRCALEAIN